MKTERPLKLLYLQPAEAFGGAERQGVEHIRALPRLGVEVTALVGPGEAILQELATAGVQRYIYVQDFPSTGKKRPAWAGTVGDWLQWFKVARRCRRTVLQIARSEPFDVVFANRAISWPLAGMISAHLGIPYIIRSGGRPANPLTRLVLIFLRLAFPPPALFVANCEAVRAPLERWFACPSRILRNGVDVTRYSPREMAPSRVRMNLAPEVPIVGMAARPAPEKGLKLFAEAARTVLHTVPDALFVVAGEHVTRAHYEHMVSDMGLAQHVRFLGHVQDMASFYASCDAVVLTSPHVSIEGSPNALLEAMAMARPIVATRVGGVPELVRHGVDGFLEEPSDPGGFAARVVQLLSQPKLRWRMGWSGRRRVLQSFSSESVVGELAQIVRSCAPNGHSELALVGGMNRYGR